MFVNWEGGCLAGGIAKRTTWCCGSDADTAADRKKLLDAFGGGDVAVGAALAGMFVAYLGMAPALAGIVAALTLKYFFRPGYAEFCGLWLEKLPKK